MSSNKINEIQKKSKVIKKRHFNSPYSVKTLHLIQNNFSWGEPLDPPASGGYSMPPRPPGSWPTLLLTNILLLSQYENRIYFQKKGFETQIPCKHILSFNVSLKCKPGKRPHSTQPMKVFAHLWCGKDGGIRNRQI